MSAHPLPFLAFAVYSFFRFHLARMCLRREIGIRFGMYSHLLVYARVSLDELQTNRVDDAWKG
ncbi:hypothetical protein K469DRAFT_721453 [Zopfia rhizophila CBS 207.26]|uniref:Uncharacterized protein n=1 Tax=Zopfia rhizophila CBS 207.26 TaxID=1314779 RepID=A0A6A6EGY4_9PEZI|nr:hypothetical protein K469DRAFT_721453 [Zopfia rhizophila CBS 207.26]